MGGGTEKAVLQIFFEILWASEPKDSVRVLMGCFAYPIFINRSFTKQNRQKLLDIAPPNDIQ
jgi:hypothetical protein